MAIHTTRWSPDTCGCELEYTWDDTQPAETRTHTFSNITKTCSAHAGLSTPQDKYNAVLDENTKKKNPAIQAILDNAPSSLYDIQDGTTDVRIFKKNISITFTWTGEAPNRILTLNIAGITLTTNQKTAIQTKIDQKFGAGVVTLA